jgi:excisionase family DNA binding protein
MTSALTSRIARSRRHRYGGDGHRHHPPAAFRPSGSWRGSMNADGMPDYRRQPVNGGSSSVPTAAPTPRIIRHLAFALPLHVRQLRQSGLPVPAEVDEWAAFLSHSVGVRPELTVVDHDLGGPQHASAGPRPQQGHLVTRLLVTKAEAAERLSVSERTIERLVAAGRLPVVHVERAARIRVCDLEAFVHRSTGGARITAGHVR